jgi:uncharacterized protein YjbJ (UPF0337 family)
LTYSFLFEKLKIESELIPIKVVEEVTMNTDILKGEWKRIKGEVKVQWGKLTDDDLTQIEGEYEKLIGILQKRYGYSRDEAMKEYDNFMARRKGKAA